MSLSISDKISILRKDYLEKGAVWLKSEHGILCKESDGLVIFNYNTYGANWDYPPAELCRGIIFKSSDLSLVALGLCKFWNLGESRAALIDWDTVEVFEKLDGSLVQRYWNPNTNDWGYSTQYQLPSDLIANVVDGIAGVSWDSLIRKALKYSEGFYGSLDQPKDETYVFELTSPINRIVVRNEDTKLRLIAIRENNSLIEKSVKGHAWAPQSFNFSSLMSISSAAEALSGLESEGFVVRSSFGRLKIKGSDYVRLHHIRGEPNSLKNISNIYRNNDLEEICAYFPEIKVKVDVLSSIVSDIIAELELNYSLICKIDSQKEFASAAKLMNDNHIIYKMRASAKSARQIIDDMDDHKFFRLIKDRLKERLVKELGGHYNDE